MQSVRQLRGDKDADGQTAYEGKYFAMAARGSPYALVNLSNVRDVPIL